MLGANLIIKIQTIVNSQKIASISIFLELWLYEFALNFSILLKNMVSKREYITSNIDSTKINDT